MGVTVDVKDNLSGLLHEMLEELRDKITFGGKPDAVAFLDVQDSYRMAVSVVRLPMCNTRRLTVGLFPELVVGPELKPDTA